MKCFIFIFCFLCLVFGLVQCRRHVLNVKNDNRRYIDLTAFGFRQNGSLLVNVTGFHFTSFHDPMRSNGSFGLTLSKATSSGITPVTESRKVCPLSKRNLDGDGISAVFFTLDLVEKGFRLDHIGFDLKKLPVYYQPEVNPPATTKLTSKASRNQDERDYGYKRVDVRHGLLPIHVDANDQISFNFMVFFEHEYEEGLYSLFFYNCYYDVEGKDVKVNFTMHLVEGNSDGFLSAGETMLPRIYFSFFATYAVVTLLWCIVLKRATEGVFKTHFLMLSFLIVKALSLLFHSIDYHFILVKGHHEKAFAILYYMTYLMKGTMLLVTLLLIGAGVSFIKDGLSRREKVLFVVAVPLQMLSNVAQVIIQETEEGSASYTTWKTLFLMMDLICCGVILFPVVWSIRYLKKPFDIDEEDAAKDRTKFNLKRFRYLYIIIVIFIYTSRIIAYLLVISLPFQYEWFCALFKESANIVFFVMVGVKFRPASDNRYRPLAQSDVTRETQNKHKVEKPPIYMVLIP